ncbi:MAG: quinone-dependent dihydroorotate dehydrogenase [SAR324 cluster bacterium]|nr:quinone-dependent dihydroorotate dehydrogenase [SAR324 cluster bacterium]
MFFLKPVLHRFDPEWIHDRTISFCSVIQKFPFLIDLCESVFSYEKTDLSVEIGNLIFTNPIGLAAGFDKNGLVVPMLQALGFGFIETGTITPVGQPGNIKPRLFRIRNEQALINQMGFNNSGVNALVKALNGIVRKIPIGVNLGKNKLTPIAIAHQDYITGLESSWSVADYFTINISSPNTHDLRELQKKDYLNLFLEAIFQSKQKMEICTGQSKQVWLKIAPDLSDEELKLIAGTALELKIDAIIVGNTTTSRLGLGGKWKNQPGGLSGKPLFNLSNRILDKVKQLTEGKIPLVAAGGVFSAEDVRTKISLGARLVQLYTGLIFEGPGLIKKIKKELGRSK